MFELKQLSKNFSDEVLENLRFPDEEFLNDYQDLRFSDMVSTPGVNAIIGMDTIELGDSGKVYQIIPYTELKGKPGIEKLKEYCLQFEAAINDCLPYMSENYQKFFQHFLADKKQNGVVYPVEGRIL